MVTIYDKTGVEIPNLDTSHAGVSYSADLGSSNLGAFEVSFYSANAVTIPAHSYINPNDSDDPTDWYYLLDVVAPADTDKGYYYALTFEHFSKLFQQIEFYYEDATGAKQYSWTLSDKLDMAAGLILSAIQREFPTFGVTLGGYLSDTDSKDFEFDGLNVYEAATYIAETFETELWFYGSEMHFEEAIFGKSLPHELTHTVNIEDSITAEYDGVRPQYVRALGGLTNMPVSTEGAIAYQGRLSMPEGKEVLEIEGVETGVTLNLKLDDYFPSMGGTITEVEYNDDDENPIYFVKTDLGYTLDSVKIDNGTVRVMYFTGGISAQLTGREFDVEDYGDDQIQIFRIKDGGNFIPRPYIAPAVGDTFLLKNVTVNDDEIAEAQEKLEAYVDDYVETLRTKSPNITLTTASVYYANNPHTFRIGESVKVTHPSILGGSTTSRVIGISIADWAEPSKVTLTIQDKISAGRVSTLESDLQDLTANVNSTATSSNVIYDTRYIRKDKDDATSGSLGVGGNLRVGDTIDSMIAGKGIIADANGRMQLSRLEVRDSMTVRELLINKLSVIDGDQVLSEGDTIDTIDDLGSNCYGLHLKNKWDGYFTAQVVGNVLKGKINTLAEGNGTYYTSWMRVNSVNTANNYIEVVLYDDDDVPGGVNFPPCELMAIVRWGNQIDKTRQSCLYLSSTEGRITKLTGVTKPILESYNYGATIGSVPSFLKDLDLPLVDGQDYAYMRGLIVEDIIRIDYQGKPITEIVDRGTWSEDSSYYSDALNPATGKYETSDVWYMGCKYRCAQTGTTAAPAWNNTDWAMVEGNPDFTVEFADTDFIFDPDRFNVTLEIIAKLYNINITSDILDADVTWTRYSEDAQGLERVASDNAWAIKRAGAGKTIQLTADDCDFNGYVPKTLRFTATVTLRDGMGTNNAIFEY